MRARRVDEGDQRVLGAGPRLLVDQPGAARLELRQRGVDVVHAQRDVVQARAALVGVLRDRRIGRGRFEQFQLGLADRQEMRAHALRGDLFGRFDLEAERVAIERERRREILHRDADVIEDSLHGFEPCESLGLEQASFAAVYGIDLARGDAVDDRAELARREHLPLEVIHEALRDQLAQPVLAARPAPRRLHALRMRAELRDRLDQLRDPLPGRRDGLHDRRPPLAAVVGVQRQIRLDRRTPAARRLRDRPC